MKKVELKDVKPYEAPGHFKMVALRLQHKETTGVETFWVGLSYFLPGGGAEMSASDFERVLLCFNRNNDCGCGGWNKIYS